MDKCCGLDVQKDLIRGSFVPDDVLRQMRRLTRRCRRLTKNRVRFEQQMDNQLQRCNICFSNYVSGQGNNSDYVNLITGQILIF
ncbi:MAG: hypothetical protein LBS03_08065, partial [Bacteroidales bacterium]|nr:hypothetical protein [Bacteroidales bacterium]